MSGACRDCLFVLPVLASVQPSLFVSHQKYLKSSLLESSESPVMFVKLKYQSLSSSALLINDFSGSG